MAEFRTACHQKVIYRYKLEGLGDIPVVESLSVSSTTFTQWVPKAKEFAEITHNNGHYAIQGHRFWYQSKAHVRLPISD